MNRLREQINIHLLVLLVALAIPVAAASFLNNISLLVTTVMVSQTLLLALVCTYHITSIKKYCKVNQYCTRIRREHDRVVKSQAYKMHRLSFEEQQMLQYITSPEAAQELSNTIVPGRKLCYRKLENIMRKLEIPLNESPFDVDWKMILG